MADNQLPHEPAPPSLKERDRFAQILMLFGRHGLKGLGNLLGLGSARDDDPVPAARPEAVVALLRDIGPVAVKFGQVLAMRSDLLGPEWIAALSTLQDRVPPLPFETVRPLIEDAIGGTLDSCFSRLEEQALAAASIAQVHAATLLDGREVIVKVRRPGIERIVDADLRILRRLARMAERRVPEIARLQPDELLRHFAESLAREMDLSTEARTSESMGVFLADLGVRTASFHWELTGSSVNVQDRLRGIPATDLAGARGHGVDLQAMATAYAQAVLRMIVVNGQFHADPHPGNVFFLDDGSLAFIDFGAVGTLLPRRRDELVRLALAIAGDDVAALVDILLLWAGDPDVDRDRLEVALAELVGRFRNVVLGKMDLADIFQRVFALLREYHLSLPPDLALVLRTLLTAEGFVRRIDPAFDIAAQLAPLGKDLLRERTSPARLGAAGRRLFSAFGRAALSAPDLIGLVEKFSRTGTIPVSIASRDLDRLSSERGGQGRGDPQTLPAALAVCAAILYASEPRLAAGVAGLAVVLLLAGWVSGRRR